MKKGIDVSTHNGVIDWEKVKKNIDYAIIRCGYGMNLESQDDKYFKRNIEECVRLEIPFGVYLYSYANTIEKADSESEHVLRLVNPYQDKIMMGIWYDVEDKIQDGLDKNALKEIITTFCNKIEANGYYVGIYANKNWLENKIEESLRQRYVIWVAQYYKECTYGGKYHMWQYSSTSTIEGIQGKVDTDYAYQDTFVVEVPKQPPEELPQENPKEEQKADVIYQVYDNTKKKFLNEITNCNDNNTMGYAGNFGNSIGAYRVRLSNGAKVTIKAHVTNKTNWLNDITKWDDTSMGYAGIKGSKIDMIMMKAEGCTLAYRAHTKGKWLSWIEKMDENDYYHGMAGSKGNAIDAIQIKVI